MPKNNLLALVLITCVATLSLAADRTDRIVADFEDDSYVNGRPPVMRSAQPHPPQRCLRTHKLRPNPNLRLFANGGDAMVKSAKAWKLRSIDDKPTDTTQVGAR